MASIRPEEAEFHRLAQEIAGFGGFYFDEGGTVVAYVTDISRSEQARTAVQNLIDRSGLGSIEARSVLIRQGKYAFPELAAWRDRITDPVLDIEGVLSVDADEARNRVAVGVARSSVQGHVERVLAEFNVPRDAVLIEVEEEMLNLVSEEPNLSTGSGSRVDSRVDPLQGGVQIARWVDRSTGKITRCSLGAVVRRDGLRLFLTASHCSERSWDHDNTVFYQPVPDYNDAYRIGHEYQDVQGTSCGFLSVNVCRYSDALLARTDDGVLDALGRIARTRYAASSIVPDTIGSLEIDTQTPYFGIIGKTTAYSGQPVQKMGARTGWTRGTVNQTCVDKPAQRSYSKLRCQTETTAWVSRGDSGGPVFLLQSDGTAYLLGIMWGRTKSGSYSYYSPITGIEQELGTLTVTDYVPPPSDPNEPPPGEGCPTDPEKVVC